MNVATALSAATLRLTGADIRDARLEASGLLAFALQKPAVFLIAHPEYELTAREEANFLSLIDRRAAREPFHYITGSKEFYGLEFEVSPAVLIPRPETEILVEKAVAALNELNKPHELAFCEIGVGSGCISVSILKNVPSAVAVATDISLDAIAVARRNAESHDVSDRLRLIEGDLFAAVDQKFDLIVSNPPYIPVDDVGTLQTEVRGHEPHSALFAGNDGLDVVRRLVAEAPKHLKPGGFILIEMGYGQSEVVGKLFDRNLWDEHVFLKDLQQIPRIAVAKLN